MRNTADSAGEDDYWLNYVFLPFIVLTLSWSVRSQMNKLSGNLFAAAESRPVTAMVPPKGKRSSPFTPKPMNDLDGAPLQQRTRWWALEKSQIIQCCIVQGFLVLILHRVGLLLTRRVQKTNSVTEQTLGMALFSVIVAFVVSSGDATQQAWKALVRSSRGHNHNGRQLPTQPDQTDGVSNLVLFASFSLVIPWVGLLTC
ncbi:hypothetical protein LTR84_009691 [Exophiala bonariae]|uniref:Uncharacterized protein n=1 Tax=Exophiala bonariae TaxID=1690606 RepID=A0AAV9NJF9_9EURO|nr:hypothetical protein LTR84_009691 [Exophiala bonariae]